MTHRREVYVKEQCDMCECLKNRINELEKELESYRNYIKYANEIIELTKDKK